MRYLTTYKLYESSTLTKSELIQTLGTLSKGLYDYINDYNSKTKMCHNLHFSYANLDTITLMSIAMNVLTTRSPDGLIRLVCDEWIKIKGRMGRSLQWKGNEPILGNQYSQSLLWYQYYKVGKQIEDMISGSMWDIPETKVLQDDDIHFITDSIISEYDSCKDFSVENYWDGVKIKVTIIDSDVSSIDSISKTYESNLIKRLDSYFNGLVIMNHSINSGSKRDETYIVLYLPFWRKYSLLSLIEPKKN